MYTQNSKVNVNDFTNPFKEDKVLSKPILNSSMGITKSVNPNSEFIGSNTEGTLINHPEQNLNIKSSSESLIKGEKSIRNIQIFNEKKIPESFKTNQGIKDFSYSSNTIFNNSHLPTTFLSRHSNGLKYDKFTSTNSEPTILNSSIEFAPKHL